MFELVVSVLVTLSVVIVIAVFSMRLHRRSLRSVFIRLAAVSVGIMVVLTQESSMAPQTAAVTGAFALAGLIIVFGVLQALPKSPTKNARETSFLPQERHDYTDL